MADSCWLTTSVGAVMTAVVVMTTYLLWSGSSMWTKLQSALGYSGKGSEETKQKVNKYEYRRPDFLSLSEKEFKDAKDILVRNVITSKQSDTLPRQAGYAEVINGGKSPLNEDQAAAELFYLYLNKDTKGQDNDKASAMTEIGSDTCSNFVPVTYFAIFDGHAGPDCALMAAKTLHNHVQEKLNSALSVINIKMNPDSQENNKHQLGTHESITIEHLIVGILEEAFQEMDQQIEQERHTYVIKGGCAVVVILLVFGKVFIANAGDCRAVLCNDDQVIPLSTDHTPFAEKTRLYKLGETCPELLYDEFTVTDYTKRILRSDLGSKILFKRPCMTGWSCKIADVDDLKFPLVTRSGKKSRLMETIGVARGLGDHDLGVYVDTNMLVKPFLSAVPEVQVLDIKTTNIKENAVVIMASDGLWDVITNEEARQIVTDVMKKYNNNDYKRYTAAAEELVTVARGLPFGGAWKKKDGEVGSFDDISVFVVPLHD